MNDLNVFAMSKGKCLAWMLCWVGVGLAFRVIGFDGCDLIFYGFGGFYGLAFFFKQLADNKRAAQNRLLAEEYVPQPTQPKQPKPTNNQLFLPTRGPNE